MTIGSLIKNISSKEWWFLFWLILVVILITTSPYSFGYLNTPKGSYYLGMSILSPGDIPVYYSYINQARRGNLIFRDLFTPEAQSPTIINTYWLPWGSLARTFNFSEFLIYQLARIFTIPFLIFALYLLIAYLVADLKKRRITLIFMLFSTGISGLFATQLYAKNFSIDNNYFHLPTDLWVSESNIFLTLLHSGHFMASLALMVLIFLLMLISLELKKIYPAIWAGILVLILFSFHPFPLPVIFGVLGVFWLILIVRDKMIDWQFFKSLVIFGLISSPLILYYFWVEKFDLITAQRAAQNINLTPAWYLNIFGYGFLLVFGIWGLFLFFKNKEYFDNKKLFLTVWLITQFIIIYLPFSFQRRTVEGLQIPLVFFATFSLFFIYQWLKSKLSAEKFNLWVTNPSILIFLFIIFFGTTNFLIWFSNLHYYLNDKGYFYWPKEEILTMKYLADLSKNAIILSSPTAGNLIPGFSGRTVFAGHRVETLFYKTKEIWVNWFFSDNFNDEKKVNFLKNNNISHLYYGELERKMGEFEPEAKNYLKKIYQQGEVAIYQVIDRE